MTDDAARAADLLAEQKRKTRKLRIPNGLSCWREDEKYDTGELAELVPRAEA